MERVRNQTGAANHSEKGGWGPWGDSSLSTGRGSMVQGWTSLWVQGSGLRGGVQHLEQELETGDALERQNQEGLEGKALADGGTLQLLQDLSEAAVAVPAGQGASGEEGRRAYGGHSEGAGCGGSMEHLWVEKERWGPGCRGAPGRMAEGALEVGWGWQSQARHQSMCSRRGGHAGPAIGGHCRAQVGTKWGIRSHSRLWKVRSW